jgi:hypothetical protein
MPSSIRGSHAAESGLQVKISRGIYATFFARVAIHDDTRYARFIVRFVSAPHFGHT